MKPRNIVGKSNLDGKIEFTFCNTDSIFTTGSFVASGGAAVAKDLYVGDDLLLLSDATVLKFGADSDVSLTHVNDSGIQLNTTMQLQFRDSNTYINSDAANTLNCYSHTGINLNIF